MTEDELKQKWCPFARVMNIDGDGGGSLCIGSACAAHRVQGGVEMRVGVEPPTMVYGDHYCGLAGWP